MNLTDKTVFVTGGAVRVGAAVCEAFAQRGAKVVIHYNHSEREAKILQKKLDDYYNASCLMVKFDLAGLPDMNQIFNQVGPIDILINNASTFKQDLIENEKIEDAKIQFDVNFWAPYQLMKAFVEQKLASGVIINLLDQRITKIDPKGASYPLSKKCLSDLTLTAAWQFAPNIRVNGVAPGPVLPPVDHNGPGMTIELNNVPLERPVDLNDLADSCVFLAENESITGQILYVDCGQHLSANC